MKKFLKIFAMALVGATTMGFVACNNGGGSNSKTMVVTPAQITFDVDGNAVGNNTVTVIGADWSASVGSGQDWIHISDDAGTDGGMFTVTVAGEAMAARQGTITVTNILNTTIQKYITVKQEGPAIIQDPDAETILSVDGNYWGDYYGVGISNFDLNMYTTELDEYGDPIGDGHYVYIDFFSEDPASLLHPEIASGTYEVNESMGIYTVIPGYLDEEMEQWISSVFVNVVNGEFTEILAVTGGTYQVMNEGGGNYVMAYDFDLSDGSNFKGYFEGQIDILNPNIYSNLTGDVEIPTMTKGVIDFWGDYYENGTYNFTVNLHSEGFNLDEYTGSGDLVTLEMFSAQEGDGTVIPSGTYVVDSSMEAGTIAPGEFFWGIFPINSWYTKMVDGFETDMGPFFSGQIELTYNNGIYNIDIDVTDDIGYSITGDFEGPLDYAVAGAPQPAPVKTDIKAFGLNKFNVADQAKIKTGRMRAVR